MKKESFHFSFKISFPIILSNQILQHKSPCSLCARATPSKAEGEWAREKVVTFTLLAQLHYTTSKAGEF